MTSMGFESPPHPDPKGSPAWTARHRRIVWWVSGEAARMYRQATRRPMYPEDVAPMVWLRLAKYPTPSGDPTGTTHVLMMAVFSDLIAEQTGKSRYYYRLERKKEKEEAGHGHGQQSRKPQRVRSMTVFSALREPEKVLEIEAPPIPDWVEQADTVQSLLEALTPAQREVVARMLRGESPRDISAALGVTRQAVSFLYRGSLRRMRAVAEERGIVDASG